MKSFLCTAEVSGDEEKSSKRARCKMLSNVEINAVRQELLEARGGQRV